MVEIANLNQISIDLVELIAPLLALTLSIGIGLFRDLYPAIVVQLLGNSTRKIVADTVNRNSDIFIIGV